MVRLHSLRNAATSEFELSGPFPVEAYGRMMDATSKILDSFHAMNLIIQKDTNVTETEAALLKFTSDERAQLCARISHLFQGIIPNSFVGCVLTNNLQYLQVL